MSVEELRLTLPLPPSINEYLAYRVVWIGKRHIAQPYKTKKAIEYVKHIKYIVKRELKQQEWNCDTKDDYIEVFMTFYINKKRKDSHNMEKVLFDGLMECGVYPDDDILIPKTENIFIDKYNPRVELVLKKSKKKGIFKDDRAYNEFKKANCDKCRISTYNRRCKVLVNALENRIEPDITNSICLKKKLK